MNSYMTDKYAGMLTEEDVANLFDILVKKLGGNRSEAARRCGLTGKATYDWQEATYVKLETKRKVLETSLKEEFLETMEFLLGRSTSRNLDLLRTILSTFYANALDAGSRDEFEKSFTKFEAIRNDHHGIIRDGIQDEVTDMTSLLRKRASELGVTLGERTINEFSAEEMINAMQLVGRVYAENPMEAETFAVKDLGLPSDALRLVIQTFKNLCFTRDVQTTTLADEYKKVDQRLRTLATGKLFWATFCSRLSTQKNFALQHQLDENVKEETLHETATTT